MRTPALSMLRRRDLIAWTARVATATMTATSLGAQVPGPAAQPAPGTVHPVSEAQRSPDVPREVRLLVGRSAIINAMSPIARVSLTTPDVADALITGSQQVLVHGKTPGTISLLLWDKAGSIATYEVVVERDITLLVEQIQQLFPGETITVRVNGRDVVLAGTVSSKYVVEKAAEVAAGYVEKKEQVVNLLRQDEGATSNQILLRVRFAEVSRGALTELGAALFSSGYKNVLGRTTTQQFAAPEFEQTEDGLIKTVFSDFLNLFIFDLETSLGATIKALQSKGLFQSLAEPNLVAQNGKDASFLAGGEYPYPAVQGGGANLAVTVQFKEYGIRLNFTPTILRGDVIHLKVRPEVSSLDFTNAVSVQGFRVPSLTTRRADTEVELRDGQTFAIAGLLNNTLTQSFQKVPGIGDIPILGLLFKSKALQKAQTELVVMITPQILRRNSTGASSGELPRMDKPYLEKPPDTIPMPPPYLPGQPTRPPGGTDAAGQPQSAAASALEELRAAAATRKLTKEEKQLLERLQDSEEKQRQADKAQQEVERLIQQPPTGAPNITLFSAQAEQQKKAAEQAEAERKARAEQEKKAAEQAEREKALQAEQAERERKAQAEREKKAAAEQAERERKAQAEREKKAAEQAEAERKAQAEREKKAAEQAEAERKAQEEQEKKAAEEAERERKAKAEREKKAAEQAERERKAKAAEAERERKLQAELQKKLDDLSAQQKKLADEQAKLIEQTKKSDPKNRQQ